MTIFNNSTCLTPAAHYSSALAFHGALASRTWSASIYRYLPQSLLFHLPLMVRLLLHELSDDLHILLLSQWLDVRSLVTLDVAVSSNTSRPYWKTLLGSLRSSSIDSMDHSASSLMWLIRRGICASRIQMKDNAWRVP